MKIIKIELQNINSLKSDSIIEIDFENEQFKDIGLYAITGGTGAGKTTILDAITIALYNNVPRFIGTKGALTDVVSYGANDAFSRLTFENNNVIYEASWKIRIADKSGKKYKNPKEEVCLKNLTTGEILATQKKILYAEIIRVTQLDYNQFLRSVMLAQGEFASFLSAKGPEKGKLLEQITGEQIYKKIGQGILDRKASEENKLREIQSKINSEDVLSEDKKIELTQNDKILDLEINKKENEISATQKIVDWYIDFRNTIGKTEELEQKSKEIDLDIEKHKPEFKLLDLNEKAEPFKELITNFNRTENDINSKAKQLTSLNTELTTLIPEINNLDNNTKNQSAKLEKANNEFIEWLPKFDLITSIDSQLRHEADNKDKTNKKLEDLIPQIRLLKDKQTNLSKKLVETESKIKSDEAFISQNKFLKDVDGEISKWASELTLLNANKRTINENSAFITQKNKEIVTTTTDKKRNKELLDKKINDIKIIEEELSVITANLAKNNISELLVEKEKISQEESNLKQFKNLSEQTAKSLREQNILSTQKKGLLVDLNSLKKQIEETTKHINTQEESVADADKILNLEKSISKYENDRQNLKKGEPCGLCGSTQHPFTENLISIGISKSELELNQRKDKLTTLIDSKSKLDKEEVKLNTTIEGKTQQINNINEELFTFKTSAKQLNIDYELSDLSNINIQLNLATEKIQSINKKLKIAQQLQIDKDQLSKNIELQNQTINTLNTNIATLEEKTNNSKKEIEIKQKSIDSLNKICTDLENSLTTKLSVFNYKLPSVEHTNSFIQKLEESVNNFNKKQKELNDLKAAITVINNNLENSKKQEEIHLKTQKEYIKTITESATKSDKLKTERISILPINISVESKREGLQLIKNQLSESVEFSKKELQKLLNLKTEKEALIVKSKTEQKILFDELSAIKSSLDIKIKSSDFESKQEIENALLITEDKLKYTKNKERIKESQLILETLKEENIKAKNILNESKNFKVSEDESKILLEKLKTENNSFLTEKGKIFEAFRKDQEIRDRNKETYKKIDAQAEICGVWKELFKLIGNSKDAFNVYVQRLTLKHLLDLANIHLYKLNKRYSLKMEDDYKPREELNFNLIDHYQVDQARIVDTSSGGEKFIISLALALGLSDLASKNVKIDSLFIDEGFGSLDYNTLETVISTLETLQTQGKMIGIISHVENLKERISTQIQIIKKSNGISEVNII